MTDSTPAPAPGHDPESAEEKTLDRLLAEAQQRIDEQKEAWMRAVAEAENIRKRSQAEVAAAHKFAVERFAEGLLPVADSLEAALMAPAEAPQALRDGVELTLRQLQSAFAKGNLQAIAPQAGEKFDPNRHQAMAAVEAPGAAPNTVVSVLQKGYQLHERVLRPALVAVAKAVEKPAESPISSSN